MRWPEKIPLEDWDIERGEWLLRGLEVITDFPGRRKVVIVDPVRNQVAVYYRVFDEWEFQYLA